MRPEESNSSATPAQQAAAYFRYLKSIGVDFVEPGPDLDIPLPPPELATAPPETVKQPSTPAAVPQPVTTEQTQEQSTENRVADKKTKRQALLELRDTVNACTACELHKTRTNTVFGSGLPRARIMFVGEAPGADEDMQGQPFVGRAGKLLTKMIEAMGYERKEVFIANVLKCRPPGNRDPKPDEVEKCEGYLLQQIEIIKPKVICALGTHAAQTLLKTGETIGRLRGRFHDYHGVPLLPTYHPAFLLRSPQFKKLAWEDLQMVRDKNEETP